MAFVSHMASAYGEMRSPSSLPRGGLAPWQERRAKELLDARLDGAVSLADLATACELSVRQFTRAFRQSTGQSPHRWLVERRLDKAQGLLEVSAQSLNDVAAASGFANQSLYAGVHERDGNEPRRVATSATKLRRYFDFAATSLAAFSMKAATDLGCDT